MSQSSSAAAEQAAEEAMYALWAKWEIKNHNTAKDFGIAIGALMGHFMLTHWAEILLNKYNKKPRALVSMARSIRWLSRVRIIGGFALEPSKALLLLLFIGMNAALTFYDHPENAGLTILAKRFGWMLLCNLCLTVFLGLKNTPLSPLAGVSFDHLNVVHRCCGYITIVFLILHAVTYVSGLAYAQAIFVMDQGPQHSGAVAGCAMLALLITAIGPIRKRFYEFFYASHLILVVVILITVGLHRPEIQLKAYIITILASSFWIADKAFRLTRWIYHGYSNYATITPLADHATRVTLHKPLRAQPGSSAFLWIPGVRLLERHPFTIVTPSGKESQPAQFVIKARNGFTKALYEQACKAPGSKWRASVEGPYGCVPNLYDFKKVVLLAGGSGATFTMAMALDWVRRRRTPNDAQSLDFIWTVKHKADLEWFQSELAELSSNPRVTIDLHVTDDVYRPESSNSSFDGPSPDEKEEDEEKVVDHTRLQVRPAMSNQPSSESSIFKAAGRGRPNVKYVVNRSLRGMRQSDRVLVASCGPHGLLRAAESAVAEHLHGCAPSIKLYTEEFVF